MPHVLHFTDDIVVCGSETEAAAIILVSRVIRRALVRMHLRLERITFGPPHTYLGQRIVLDYRNWM